MKSQGVTPRTDGFARGESGAMSVLNLYFLMALAICAGVAIDVSNVVAARTQLQTVADAAAHTALVEREWHDADDAKDSAVAMVLANMPESRFGDVLTADSIKFGEYDRATGVFTVDDTSRDAVWVETERLSSNGNSVSTFLLQFVGLWDWDVRTTSVFETFRPTCLIEGFVADDVIDIQSNNSYFNGFCIHSNNHVTVNNNNFFEAGTVVSMPDADDIVVNITGNGEDKNVGLEDALREGRWFIKILNRIAEIERGLQIRTHRYARSYTSNFDVVQIDVDMRHLRQGNKYVIGPGDLQAGRIYRVDCQKVDFKSGTYDRIVFIADCPVELSNGVVLTDVVLLTTFDGSKAFYSPANIVLGRNDSCASGGGAQIVTNGDVDFSAGVEMYGSQIIAGGNVEFSSNADGLQGASIVAGGRIDSTSNMNFSFCGTGMEHSFLAEYFRLAG